MELEILKLIYNYSVNGKLVDPNFISKLVEIVVSKNSLDNYVKNVQFTNQLKKTDDGATCASYNPLSMKILIDYESLQIVMENRSFYDQLFNELEQIMFRNIQITQIILHELEHAVQNKQADNKSDNSIEAKLARASLFLEQAIKNPKFLNSLSRDGIPSKDIIAYKSLMYDKYYKLNPIEKLANVNSAKTILSSLDAIKNYIPNLYEFQNAILVEEMLKGYIDSWNQGICPTQVYLDGNRQSNVWTDMDFYDQDSNQLMKNVCKKYDLSRRLSLGLPVNADEYKLTENWLKGTNKFSI